MAPCCILKGKLASLSSLNIARIRPLAIFMQQMLNIFSINAFEKYSCKSVLDLFYNRYDALRDRTDQLCTAHV